jgi:beta-phosphoglucomutase-like phosphatase (HAD superfamily)
MKAWQLEAIIFDAEGVVIDTEHLWDRSQETLLASRGITYDPKVLKPLLAGKNLLDGAQIIIDQYRMPELAEQLAMERLKLLTGLFTEQVDFISGFEAFYKTIVQPRYKAAIGTSLRRDLMHSVCQKLPVHTYFGRHIYHIEDVENRSKPDPAVFLLAARALGTHPSRCLVIEDAPAGIAAAQSAGMYAVALCTTFGAALLGAADLVVQDFAELAARLSR